MNAATNYLDRDVAAGEWRTIFVMEIISSEGKAIL